MKRIIVLLVAVCTLLGASFSAAAEDRPANVPTSREGQIIRYTLLKLWGMNWTESRKLDVEELSRRTMLFLDLAYRDTASEDRTLFPQRFEGLPNRYTHFFPKAIVEKTAYNVFGGRLNNARLADGITVSPDGYFLDRTLLYAQMGNLVQDLEKYDLPRFVEMQSVHEKGSTLELAGKLISFPHGDEGGNAQKSERWASFVLGIARSEKGGWKIENVTITEEQ